jgi:hypothetical protein
MSRLAQFRDGIRRRRQERARRAHTIRGGVRSPFIPGTENTHLLPRGKGF